MRRTKAAILEAVHKTAKGLHAAGVMAQVRLREFDRLCVPPVEPLSASKIKNIREHSRVSQAVQVPLVRDRYILCGAVDRNWSGSRMNTCASATDT